MEIKLIETDKAKTIDDIKSFVENYAPTSVFEEKLDDKMIITIAYRNNQLEYVNHSALMRKLEEFENDRRIEYFRVISSNLEEIFHGLIQTSPTSDHYILKGAPENSLDAVLTIDDSVSRKMSIAATYKNEPAKQSVFEVAKHLFRKRFLHFKRNYRLIICVLVLPTLFEIIAMGFMTLRPPGEYDINLPLTRDLYANSTEFYR